MFQPTPFELQMTLLGAPTTRLKNTSLQGSKCCFFFVHIPFQDTAQLIVIRSGSVQNQQTGAGGGGVKFYMEKTGN